MAVSGHLRFDWPDHPGSPAEALIRAGRYAEALIELDPLATDQPDNCKLLRIKHQALMGLRRFEEAAEVIARAVELQPDNRYFRKLHAIAVKDAGHSDVALPLLLAAHEEKPEDLDVLAALCVTHFRLGDEAEALRFGQLKLNLLVESAPSGVATDPPEGAPGGRNVVSYSLWGSAAQYCDGALLNARQIPDALPGWTARFYVDESVPATVLAALREAGAELITAEDLAHPATPLMRRFLVHDDADVGRYIIRDSDSRIGSRELSAINDWLASGRGFHAIRDHPFHTELMQGGLWGGSARRSFRMSDLLERFHEQFGADHRYGADQYFLGDYVWPIIRSNLLTHDSYYSSPGSRPFPDGSQGTDKDHVGMGIVLKDRSAR